jgi:hypothetical protein
MKGYRWILIFCIIPVALNCKHTPPQAEDRRFFSKTSFWNEPIPDNPEIDSMSDHWIGLLKTEPSGNNFGINATKYTVPVYEVDDRTPRYTIGYYYLSEEEKEHGKTGRERFGHGPGFDEAVPIPDHAAPDPQEDAHMALVDRKGKIAWDMWGLKKMDDGSWVSNTGMRYPLNDDGVFETKDFEVINGESIHFHGPSRASGVPAIAGLIMYEEVMQGEIRHKLSCATRFNALQEFVYPAAWTDGYLEGGIPEGAVIQLDPELDLDQFDLLEGEKVVARALQKYGMVVVDNAGGSPIYAEGLWGHPGKSWEGILREWEGGINSIPLDHYRVLKVGETIKMGDARFRNRDPWWKTN